MLMSQVIVYGTVMKRENMIRFAIVVVVVFCVIQIKILAANFYDILCDLLLRMNEQMANLTEKKIKQTDTPKTKMTLLLDSGWWMN